jgi:glycosyltransferase involved in cell wall biosynthesis
MVSLVMPVWQPDPSWFPEAVHSALAEKGCEIELIVVDDGNPTPVAELLGDLDDPRLTVLAEPHGGTSAARNAGIAQASGEAIRFVDADDVVEPGSTGRLLELSRAAGAIAYGDTLVCDVDLRPQKSVGSNVQGDALAACLLGGFFVYITGMLFPRPVVEAAGGFDLTFAANEDYDYILRCLEHAPVRGGGFVASRYRRHGTSITGLQSVDEVDSRRALDKLFERRPDLRGSRLGREALSHFHRDSAEQMMRAGRFGASTRHLASAVRLTPSAAGEALRIAAGFPRQAARQVAAARR